MKDIIINEAAIEALLLSETGPVAADLRRRENKTRTLMRANIDRILKKVPAGAHPTAKSYIARTPEGLMAVVGIEDEGKLAEYLVKKETEKGEEVWLRPSLEFGFD